LRKAHRCTTAPVRSRRKTWRDPDRYFGREASGERLTSASSRCPGACQGSALLAGRRSSLWPPKTSARAGAVARPSQFRLYRGTFPCSRSPVRRVSRRLRSSAQPLLLTAAKPAERAPEAPELAPQASGAGASPTLASWAPQRSDLAGESLSLRREPWGRRPHCARLQRRTHNRPQVGHCYASPNKSLQ